MKILDRAKTAIWRKIRNFTASRQAADMNSEEFAEWLGLNAKRRGAWSEITYFTCLKMLAETLAKMTIKTYQKTDSGIVEVEDEKIARLLKERPNPFMTPTIFWATVEMNRNHFGNAYVYVRRKFNRQKYGGSVEVLDLWIMPTQNVRPVIDDAGIFAGKGRIWYVYTDRYSGEQYVFGSDEVMHFKTSHTFDGLTGCSVQEILRGAVEGAAASSDYMNKLYEQGMTARAALEYTGDLSPAAQEKLRTTFEDFAAGTKNAGRIVPIPLGFKLTPMEFKLSDSQFFELKKYNALQIAAAFGVTPNQLNDYEKSSYANSEAQMLAFLVQTELFIIKQYEEEINYKGLDEAQHAAKMYAKFNEKALLRTDSKTQAEILAAEVAGSIVMPNEARRKLDMRDAPGGDVLIANGNVIPLTMAGVQYTAKPTQQSNAGVNP